MGGCPVIAPMTTGQPAQRSKRRLEPAVCAGIVVAILLLSSVSAWLLWPSRQRAVEAAAASNASSTLALDRYLAQMTDTVRLVAAAVSRQPGPDLQEPDRRGPTDAWLAEIARDLPHLRAIAVFAIGDDRPASQFIRSRELGETAMKTLASAGAPGLPCDGLRIGRAILDEVSGHWLLPVDMGTTPRHGAPGHIVVSLLDLRPLQDLSDSLSAGATATMVLFRSDGTFLAGHPDAQAPEGAAISASPLFPEQLASRSAGIFQTPSASDGVERIVSYRRLDTAPLVVSVSRPVTDVLAGWRQDLSMMAVILTLFAVLSISLGLLLMRVARARDRAERNLHATLAHLEQGLLLIGPDERIDLYNRHVLSLLNLPEALMSRRPGLLEVSAHQRARGEFDTMPTELHESVGRPALPREPECYERRRPNGQVLEIRTTPLPDGGAVRTYSDVTARRKAIEDGNASMAFANSLISSSPDCIQLLDLDGNITFMSDLGQELLEISDFESVRGRPLVDLFAEEDQSRIELALRRARDGQTDRFTRMCPTRGGVAKWWDFIVTPVHRGGQKPKQFFVVARDMSARHAHAQELGRAKEAAERASQAKTQFLASMSHEIRTPLNAILGFAALARQRNGHDPELRRQIELIQKAGEALLTIINDVLDLSKIEAGKVELEERPLDLRGLVSDCISLTLGLASGKGLTLDGFVDPAIPARVVADEARLRQILLNLLNNAIKFTPSGTVSLSVAPAAQAGRMVLAVTDTGIGIAADVLPSLFQDFVQVDGAISRQFGGTGLGLSISRRLALLMSGEIGVSSSVGKGSTFHVTLPMIEAEAVESDPATMALSAPPAVAPMRILLVDDLGINLEIVGEMLATAGHRVSFASNGPGAIAAYREDRHDLILMDVQMPEMDGLETTRHIRELDDRGRRVPVIALTANVFSQQIERYRQAGMNDHLGKPFRRDALLAMVERWSGARMAATAVAGDATIAELANPAEVNAPVVDLACQNELLELIGRDKLIDLLVKLKEELPRRLNSADSAALRADAHSIAAMAGLLGFMELSEAARKMEMAVDNGEDHVPPLVRLLAARKAAQTELANADHRYAGSFDHAENV